MTAAEILHLANLAKLKLTKEESEKLHDQLEKSLEYVDNLNQLDAQSQKKQPAKEQVNITFEDGAEIKRQLTADQALKNSQSRKNNFFTVSRILK